MPVTRLVTRPRSSPDAARAVVCVGLALEAAILGDRLEVECCAAAGFDEMISQAVVGKCGALVSFGLAGGLSPQLRPGHIVIASDVVGPTGRFATDDAWSSCLLTAIPDAFYAPIAGVDVAVSLRLERSQLGMCSGAVAVDMESHVIAEYAARQKLRFVALRVVLDTLDHDVPAAALACVSSDGEASALRLARLLLRRPRDTLDLARLCAAWLSARRALASCCESLDASMREVECARRGS